MFWILNLFYASVPCCEQQTVLFAKQKRPVRKKPPEKTVREKRHNIFNFMNTFSSIP
jgi:hypothetical protein